jgi:ribonuclease III
MRPRDATKDRAHSSSAPRRRVSAATGHDKYPSKLEETIRYTFKNRSLLDHAITHTSFLREEEQRAQSDNEKLEYLGDAILNAVISILLYKKYKERNEGFLSNARSVLVRRDALTEIAHNLEIENHMAFGNGKSGVPKDSKVLSNMVEALIGAVYMDGGFRVASRVIRQLFRRYFDEEILQTKNPKNQLQEYSQKQWGVLPKYRLTRKTRDGFSVYVYVGKTLKAKGIGKSKREAEKHAADALLKEIKLRP